ncbi:MAG: 16S rRNA (guanine(966)-N(2))-methyltransferase RsmD [Pseudomonadota bacterium]
MASFQVRIIGGKWKGRKLVFPDQRGLRPTLGRARETIFNWLQGELEGRHCLDLFAGSGALGFEALSRGAASVTFVESHRGTARALRANADRLGADGATVITGRAERVLRRCSRTWEVIFVDPPFATTATAAALAAVREAEALAPGGLVYAEAPRGEPLAGDDWELIKHARTGETHFGLLALP